METIVANTQVHRYSLNFLVVLLLLFSQNIFGQGLSVQDPKIIKIYQTALDFHQKKDYLNAQKNYLKALEKRPDFIEIYYKMGQIKEAIGSKNEAFSYYQKSIELQPNSSSNAYAHFYLGSNYYETAQYDKSIPYLDKFNQLIYKSPNLLKRSRKMLLNASFAIEAIKQPLEIKPISLGKTINKFHSQYFPSLTGDKETMVYTGFDKFTQDENLYFSKFKNGLWSNPTSISEKINTKDNEGTAAISADGRTLVFTGCNKPDGFGSCDLYVSYKKGNEWSPAENLGENINTFEWESQPSLSFDGTILYFVSDRRNGLGKRDIYRSTKIDDGTWSQSQNIGNQINTADDEISPFIHPNGISLFFASDGYAGMGGMDIFSSDKTENGWSFPSNLGYPLNTIKDQVSLFITADNKTGYYSLEQNQDETQRNSVLYKFDLPKNLAKKFKKSNIVKGYIADATTKRKMSAEIEIINLNNNQIASKTTSDESTGEYMNTLTEGGNYGIFISKPGYFFKSLHFDYETETDSISKNINVFLEPLTKNAKEILENIYFDSNKFELRNESKPALEKLFKLMQLNPTLKIEISGHTDDLGKDAENNLLSMNRAKSVQNYLISKGILQSKIVTIGFGKTKPLAPNNSPENRQKNRRIEIKIL